MSTQKTTIDFILDQLNPAGNISVRKMFGEYALYCDGKVVGLICNDTLYIKITGPGKTYVRGDYQEGFAYPGAKVSMLIDGDKIEDREWLRGLVRITADSLPPPKRKKLNIKP